MRWIDGKATERWLVVDGFDHSNNGDKLEISPIYVSKGVPESKTHFVLSEAKHDWDEAFILNDQGKTLGRKKWKD